MAPVKPGTFDAGNSYVLLGDLVGSRKAPDRQALHDAVVEALAVVNDQVAAERPLEVTAGDEFQGVYRRLGDALDAAFRVRLALLPEVDSRYGIGKGATAVLDDAAGIEDGPAWWAARAAIEQVEAEAGRGALQFVRTRYLVAEGDETVLGDPAVRAALDCRDHLVGSLSSRSLRLLRGLMTPGTTQRELAHAEGISASAVSQRLRRDGIGVVIRASADLAELP